MTAFFLKMFLKGGFKMSKIQDIEVEIQRLREKLTELIEQKENLLNPEVIAASKVLDSSLNEYSEIISERVEK